MTVNSKSSIAKTTKAAGDAAEAVALTYLQAQGLQLLERNYRTPGRGGGEIDLIMREQNGTLVFIEVRQRSSTQHGGALASISTAKQKRIVYAAKHYLSSINSVPPCRFDVVSLQDTVTWLKAAFDASGY